VSTLGEKLTKLAFEDGDAEYILLMAKKHGNIGPAMVARGEDPGDVSLDVPYQLVNILSSLLPFMQKAKVAVVCRRCDERALAELTKRSIVDETRVLKIGLACSREQVEACRCTDCVPSKVDVGEPAQPYGEDRLVAELTALSPEKRMDFWIQQFRKCNKCFGCTLTCPVCFCDDCVLEERTYTPEEGIPPGVAFHLIRSFHLADKCVECGECERSCPAEIPLLALRKMVNRDMKSMFGYTAGDKDTSSPLLTTLDDQPLEDDGHAC